MLMGRKTEHPEVADDMFVSTGKELGTLLSFQVYKAAC